MKDLKWILMIAAGVVLGGIVLAAPRFIRISLEPLQETAQQRADSRAEYDALGVISALTPDDVVRRCGPPMDETRYDYSRILFYNDPLGLEVRLHFVTDVRTDPAWKRPITSIEHENASTRREQLALLPCLTDSRIGASLP